MYDYTVPASLSKLLKLQLTSSLVRVVSTVEYFDKVNTNKNSTENVNQSQ